MKNKFLLLLGCFVIFAVGYVLVGGKTENAISHEDKPHEDAAAEYERGPHRGRLLQEDDFAIEVTVFEDGVPPHYRMYAFMDGKPLKPEEVQITATVLRLDGEVNQFQFAPEADYLKADATLVEPHSFDVKVDVTYNGKPHTWTFSSYEGRTSIEPSAATSLGLEKAGSATIRDTLPLSGRIELNSNATATVRARFPGVIREVKIEQGQTVKKGDVLVRIESNDSLQVYPMKAPISGTVLSRNASVGEIAGEQPLFVISDLSQVWGELHVFSKNAQRVAIGQRVIVEGMDGAARGEGVISTLLPLAETATQTIVARVLLDNSNGQWRIGMTVSAKATMAEHTVPLAVKNDGLQHFRDFTVVFAKVGDIYEVRMLELGQTDGEYTEVLSGIKPGQEYVSTNSFLIKADIEKSGASHDH